MVERLVCIEEVSGSNPLRSKTDGSPLPRSKKTIIFALLSIAVSSRNRKYPGNCG